MRKLIENGMNCARVNGAFADTEELDKVRKLVKSISSKVALMIDVKGPEVRLNKFKEPLQVKRGDSVVIGANEESPLYPANYPELYKFIKTGDRIIIGDGDTELVVDYVENDKIYTLVHYGTVIKPGKALNLPDTVYTTEVLTTKDKELLTHAIGTGWDFVSASFVEDKTSALKILEFLDGANISFIAKIESQKGVENIDEILPYVDGIMIARGGLGVELGLTKVPMVQRLLTQKGLDAGKIVITATQMLESMSENPRPTRAEANDVALAILLGSDSVMLSGESTVGKYPTEAVKFLSDVANEIEPNLEPKVSQSIPLGVSRTADAITKATAELCLSMNDEISKVLFVSRTGTTVKLLGRHNIRQPVFAFVQNEFYARTLLLSKSVNNVFVYKGAHGQDRDNAIAEILDFAKSESVIKEGEKVLLVGKTPITGEEYFPNVFEVMEV